MNSLTLIIKINMKAFIKSHFLFLFLVIGFNSFAQKENKISLSNTIKEIADFNVFETTCTVGYAGGTSSQYKRYNLLTSLATTPELLILATNHKNPVVRLYAYQALKKRNIDIPTSLADKFKSDQDEVISLQGCLAENTRVNLLTNEIIFPSSNYKPVKE